ncbi:hypothetical protein KDA_31040 [Dictyobacter alpinus]|uniref:Uncharacterized protein n=1 Tax=Dictyobacter alpinus TaxID=2014873 RepID=A0A402B8J7_9CHLR|nr:hypothetical protein KDA_31040 [Dictyobacter alpinus]
MESKNKSRQVLPSMQKLVSVETKQKCFNWFFCYHKQLVVITIVGMLILKVVHPDIDPWT